MRLVKRFICVYRNKGFPYVVNSVISRLKYKFGYKDPIERRRKQLSVAVSQLLNSTVSYGPFRGLKFCSDSWWRTSDRASMLFGLYEKEVLESLTNIPKKYKTFINLGAGEGYYGIGVLINNLFENSYCFEISDYGQNLIQKNAEINGVADRISIHGIADKGFYKGVQSDQLSKSVLFVDIEGGEFDLFDKDIFRIFKDSIIFIELHYWAFKDAEKKLSKLKRQKIFLK